MNSHIFFSFSGGKKWRYSKPEDSSLVPSFSPSRRRKILGQGGGKIPRVNLQHVVDTQTVERMFCIKPLKPCGLRISLSTTCLKPNPRVSGFLNGATKPNPRVLGLTKWGCKAKSVNFNISGFTISSHRLALE